MRVAYKPLDERDYLRSQQYNNHNILTLGSGIGDINIFRDRRLKRGSNAFTNLIFKWGKKVIPFLQKYLLPEAKEFTKNMAGDVISGNSSVKQAFKQRGKQSLKNVGQRILRGEGGRRRRKKRKGVKRIGCKKKLGSGKKKKKNIRKKKKTARRKKTVRGGAKKTNNRKKKRLVLKKKKKHSKSLSLKGVDCSRPSMKKFCKKDIFS